MTSEIIWRPVEVRAFAHQVITTADEVREITPLLRAVADLRVPAHLAPGLHAALVDLHAVVNRLDTELQADTRQLWASADASEAMEQAVTAIMTRAPVHPRGGVSRSVSRGGVSSARHKHRASAAQPPAAPRRAR